MKNRTVVMILIVSETETPSSSRYPAAPEPVVVDGEDLTEPKRFLAKCGAAMLARRVG